MKKEKMLVKRKSTGNWSFKQIMMFGFAIIVLASIIFMQADNASAAKKKKQTQEYVSMSYKKGVLTIKGKGEMGDPIKTTVYENKNIKKVVIKKGVTAIADFAFKGCKKLKEIILPSTLKKIGAYAFEDCPIKNITIPKSVKSIEPGAFAGSSIKSITIPKTVKKLGEGVFGDCKKLESITMPGNIGVIKYEEPDDEYQPKSFVGDSCKSLKKITAAFPHFAFLFFLYPPGFQALFSAFPRKSALPPDLYFCQTFSIRICRRIFFSIRDTCTCEIPSFPAICACVMS